MQQGRLTSHYDASNVTRAAYHRNLKGDWLGGTDTSSRRPTRARDSLYGANGREFSFYRPKFGDFTICGLGYLTR